MEIETSAARLAKIDAAIAQHFATCTEQDPEACTTCDELFTQRANAHATADELGLTFTPDTLPASTQALKRATFEVHAHAGANVWTLYRRDPRTEVLTKVSEHADKPAAVKAGEAL